MSDHRSNQKAAQDERRLDAALGKPTKVFVIMSNDYPARVYTDQAKADRFVAEKIAEEDREAAKPIHQRARARIYWRSYEFEIKE